MQKKLQKIEGTTLQRKPGADSWGSQFLADRSLVWKTSWVNPRCVTESMPKWPGENQVWREVYRGILVMETHLTSPSPFSPAACRTGWERSLWWEIQEWGQERLSLASESETRKRGVHRQRGGLRTGSYTTQIEPKEDSWYAVFQGGPAIAGP